MTALIPFHVVTMDSTCDRIGNGFSYDHYAVRDGSKDITTEKIYNIENSHELKG